MSAIIIPLMICVVIFVCIFPLLILFIIAFLAFVKNLIKSYMQNSTYQEQLIEKQSKTSEEEKQTKDDSIEDSEADGLMLFDDPLFPEEFDEDEE